MQRLNVEFRSEGVALRGWLYLPEARAERPAIVMTHGFSGVKEQYLDRYAEVFSPPPASSCSSTIIRTSATATANRVRKSIR